MMWRVESCCVICELKLILPPCRSLFLRTANVVVLATRGRIRKEYRSLWEMTTSLMLQPCVSRKCVRCTANVELVTFAILWKHRVISHCWSKTCTPKSSVIPFVNFQFVQPRSVEEIKQFPLLTESERSLHFNRVRGTVSRKESMRGRVIV